MAIQLNRRIKAVLLLVLTLISLVYLLSETPVTENEDLKHHTLVEPVVTGTHIHKDEYTQLYRQDQYIPLMVAAVKPNGNSYTNSLHLEHYDYASLGFCTAQSKLPRVEELFRQIDTHFVRELVESAVIKSSGALASFFSQPASHKLTIPAVRLRMAEPDKNCVPTCKKMIQPAELKRLNRLIQNGYGLFFQVGDLPVYHSNLEYGIEFSSKFGLDFFNHGVPLGTMDTTTNRTLYYNHHNFYVHYKKVKDQFRIVEVYVSPISTTRQEVGGGWGCALESPMFLDETAPTEVLYSYLMKYINVANPQNRGTSEDTTITIPYNFIAKNFDKAWMRIKALVVRTHNKSLLYLALVLATLAYLQDSIFNFTPSSTTVHFADMRIASAPLVVLAAACLVAFSAHVFVTAVAALALRVVFIHETAAMLSFDMATILVCCYVVAAIPIGNYFVALLRKQSQLGPDSSHALRATVTLVAVETAGIAVAVIFLNLVYRQLRTFNVVFFMVCINALVVAPIMYATCNWFDADLVAMATSLSANPRHAAHTNTPADYTGTFHLPPTAGLWVLSLVSAVVANLPVYLYLTVLHAVVFYNRLFKVGSGEMLLALVAYFAFGVAANYVVNVIIYKNNVVIDTGKDEYAMAISRSTSPLSLGLQARPVVQVEVSTRCLVHLVGAHVACNVMVLVAFVMFMNLSLLMGSSFFTIIGFMVLYTSIAVVVSVSGIGLSLVTMF